MTKYNNYLMGTEGNKLLSLYKLENDNYKRYFVLNNITKCLCEKNWSIIIKDNNYLLNYDWPGNVRELRNLVERIAILSPNEKNENVNMIIINWKNKF